MGVAEIPEIRSAVSQNDSACAVTGVVKEKLPIRKRKRRGFA
jgi:hypothetical protein